MAPGNRYARTKANSYKNKTRYSLQSGRWMVDPTAKLKIMLVFLLGKIPSDTIAAIVSSLIWNDTTILQIVSYILHFIRITKDFFFFLFFNSRSDQMSIRQCVSHLLICRMLLKRSWIEMLVRIVKRYIGTEEMVTSRRSFFDSTTVERLQLCDAGCINAE